MNPSLLTLVIPPLSAIKRVSSLAHADHREVEDYRYITVRYENQ